MTRHTGPRRKYERRFGLVSDKKSERASKKLARKSEYGIALEEKQKLKFIYDIKEKQLERYVSESMRSKENPGEKILIEQEFSKKPAVAEALRNTSSKNVPLWLTREGISGTISSIPSKDELLQDVNPTLIIEHYSR